MPAEEDVNKVVIVVTGAEALDPGVVAALPDPASVIAADGALDHARAAGLDVAVLVGDLDSISAQGKRWAIANIEVEQHDPDKDHTDTELALARAVDLDPDQLVLVSGGGDRLDHTLAAIGALGHPHLTSIPIIDAWWGTQNLRVLHGPGRTTITPEIGSTISLLALHGRCTGVSTSGLAWALDDATLTPVSGRGVSNITTATPVEIQVSTGVLTIFINTQEPPR